ncbi:S1 family peptidase [Mycobacterium sp. B14F4]|uniref:S1 family peptidase n=1 Tax=Mycobacterium sp. B14F4 TaxID=3153565 RepID=UPI00325D7A52
MGDSSVKSSGRLRFAAAIAVLLAALIAPVGVAHAQGVVTLGGGSGLVVNGESLCTLTTIGNDNRGNLIGFTSAHCGGPGAQIAAEEAESAGVLGTMVAGNDALDYAVIQFDPQKVRPTNNVNGFRIDGLGPDPVVGDVACKLGRTTGYSCGVTWGPGEEPGTFVNQVCGQPGDSGAPVTVNNRLVGMIHGAFSEKLPTCIIKYVPLHTPAVNMSFNTQLADITAKNRPGTGFVPVGAVA